jgi:hypothetical protein
MYLLILWTRAPPEELAWNVSRPSLSSLVLAFLNVLDGFIRRNHFGLIITGIFESLARIWQRRLKIDRVRSLGLDTLAQVVLRNLGCSRLTMRV